MARSDARLSAFSGRHKSLSRALGIDALVLALQFGHILAQRRQLLVGPVDGNPLDRTKAAGPRTRSRWHRRRSPRRRPGHALAQHALEHQAEEIALLEATVPVHGRCRVVGNRVLQSEFAEPSVGQVRLDFLAEPTFRADRVGSDRQHPDHQLRIEPHGRPV